MISKRDLLFLIPIPIIALCNIIIPFTNDARIFQGVARLVDYNGIFPYSLDAAWEIKPLGNRLINYILYKLVSPFLDFNSPEYAMAVKTVAVLFAILCCYFFARSFKDRQIPIFSITAIAVLTPMNFIIMQAEWYSVLFSLVCIGLLLREKMSAYAAAGIVLFFIFLLKGITGLLVVPIFCFIFIWYDNYYRFFERAFAAFIGFVSAGFLFLFSCLTFFPHAIPDMMMAAQLARVGQYSVVIYINSMTEKLSTISAYIPALFFTFIVGFYLLATVKLPRTKYAALWLMWLSTFAIVFIQGEFFIYHYAVLIIPGILSIILQLRCGPPEQHRTVYAVAIGGMLLLWAIFNSPVGLITAAEVQYYQPEFEHAIEANALFDIPSQPSVLYLDPGSAPYFFSPNSSCRYSTPLPVQRHRPEWNVSFLPAYAQEYSCIMNYSGKYIIGLDWWFGKDLPERAEIYEKMNRDYVHVYNKSWDIWERR